MNNRALILITAAATLFIFSCNAYDGVIKNGIRDITVDVDNSIFSEPDAANAWEQGPGIDTLTLTFVLEDGPVEAVLSSADASSEAYTRIVREVSGMLERVDAYAENAAGAVLSVSIDDKPTDEEFHGWQVFANLQRFRLGFNGNSADSWTSGFLTLDISPLGGASIRFKVDSGVTSVSTTDWGGAALTSLRIAVEPVLSEHPKGLEFDIYTAVVDEDLRDKYKQNYTSVSADYEHYPWKDIWTYEQLTETGLRISDTVYTMTKYNADAPLPYLEPEGEGCGYNSFLIDLTAAEEDPVGKYLMFAVTSKYDGLSVPSALEIIEIR